MKKESFQKMVSIHVVRRIFIKEILILHEFLTHSFAETDRNLLLTKIINNLTSSTFVLAFSLQILYVYV